MSALQGDLEFMKSVVDGRLTAVEDFLTGLKSYSKARTLYWDICIMITLHMVTAEHTPVIHTESLEVLAITTILTTNPCTVPLESLSGYT